MEEQSAPPVVLPAPPGTGPTCAEVREAAHDALAGIQAPPSLVQDVLTVVTELASNARRHAGGVTAFQINAHPQAVTVEVSDASPHGPQTFPWAPTQPGGFGWRLVSQLADTTDVRFHPDGKTITVTFTNRQPQSL
ncbi:hypothetical protein KPP03845_100113 [Streptomyces xanthophaeus]|uniref:ATP-binding protein n=1 Tax=Streptomyces xanthophaeus TaxID=67385 RepID=UPI00233F3F44|nr:ATP-binding protein [Streptomyces xanthophaeus]WCD83794.1 hypothetical protein KPP03845_100113 [Streptomyces xanthophaeus]